MTELILGVSAALSVLATAAAVFAVFTSRPTQIRALREGLQDVTASLSDVLERKLPAVQEAADRTLATAELENEQAETRRRRAAGHASRAGNGDTAKDPLDQPLSDPQRKDALLAHFRGR